MGSWSSRSMGSRSSECMKSSSPESWGSWFGRDIFLELFLKDRRFSKVELLKMKVNELKKLRGTRKERLLSSVQLVQYCGDIGLVHLRPAWNHGCTKDYFRQ